jgi:homoserine acetyltransferase
MLMVAACASTPPAPTASLDAARQAITNAEQANAGRYAAWELSEARIKLAAANAAIVERRMVMAERFAEGSRAEAELASAKTAATKAHAVNDEIRRSTETLIEGVQRRSGGKP